MFKSSDYRGMVLLCFGLVIGNVQGSPITKENIQKKRKKIENYILKTAKGEIDQAEYWGEEAATGWAAEKMGRRITKYTFDAIPSIFFKNTDTIPFDRLEENRAIEYMQRNKELFNQNAQEPFRQIPKNIFWSETIINDDEFTRIVYCNSVDNMTIAEDDKNLLKKEPKRMNEFVEAGKVDKEEYMYFTLLNYTTRKFLQKELKKNK